MHFILTKLIFHLKKYYPILMQCNLLYRKHYILDQKHEEKL